jgi:hypothetical protein
VASGRQRSWVLPREQWFHHCSRTCTCTMCSTCGLRSGARKSQRGNVIVVRYADDLVLGFQHRADAERFQSEFRERLVRFGLELHPEKTRLIEFGRFAVRNRKQRGDGKPETFTFLSHRKPCNSLRRSPAKAATAKIVAAGSGIPESTCWISAKL